MDDIEKLLRDADPRASRDSGGPLPLDLSEPAPVFIQRPAAEPLRTKRSWWPAAAGAMAAAAAVAAVITWAPWNSLTPEPLPATPPTPSASAPDPSQSSSADPSSTPQSQALPQGLFAAWDGAHFADDEPCQGLSLPEMLVADAQGKRTKGGFEARSYALIGCLDGFAAFNPTDQYRTENNIGDTAGGMLVAEWNEKTSHWVSSPVSINTDGMEVHQESLAWPTLRGYSYEPGQSPADRMEEARKELGIESATAQDLFGPNLPSWMEAESGTELVAYGNTALEVTYPGWSMGESARGADGTVLDPVTTDPLDAATYQLMFFDAHGKAVFNMALFTDDQGGTAGGTACNDPGANYVLHGVSPSSVVVDEGELALGLVTETDAAGIERSTVSLVLADSAKQGKMCDLPTAFRHRGKMFQSDAWTGYLGFLDAHERTTYLASSEYQQAKDLAASLTLK